MVCLGVSWKVIKRERTTLMLRANQMRYECNLNTYAASFGFIQENPQQLVEDVAIRNANLEERTHGGHVTTANENTINCHFYWLIKHNKINKKHQASF